MGIFSFLGFYYSLAHARIVHAFDRDPKGTRRKYLISKVIWVVLWIVALNIDSNLLGIFLLLATIAAIPLLIVLESACSSGRLGNLSYDAESQERMRRERVLRQIDEREKDTSGSPHTKED